jgi:benzoyl-CoA reductase/2-hydroxyglutaryl-CoA dehydratase subunit BcrC/BadD/HgdB
MVGPAADRAERIVRDCQRFGAAAVVISRIPGASHCAGESATLARAIRNAGLPVVEIEVPPISDSLQPAIRTRLQALIESAKSGAEIGEKSGD